MGEVAARPSSPDLPPRTGRLARLAVLLLLFLSFPGLGMYLVTSMPGSSHTGPFQPLGRNEIIVRRHLQSHVQALAGTIGERHIWRPGSLAAAADFLERSFRQMGYRVERQEFQTQGVSVANLEVEIRGHSLPEEIVVVGAHYDTVRDSPGADDNGSGVAALLELGRLLLDRRYPRTIRLVAFANEESPFYASAEMGSQVYAARARQREERIVAMLSLETMGYYTSGRKSQQYPFPFGVFYPDRGCFLAFVGNLGSRELVRQAISLFRASTPFPSEGTAAPGWLTGIGWSDHRSFWQQGYPAIMLTDTAMFRYPFYHRAEDTPDRLSYGDLARVTVGLAEVVRGLAAGEPSS